MSSPLTSHVLDTAIGRPARGIAVIVERRNGDTWGLLARGVTNDDGRVPNLLAEGALDAGTYRVTFLTGPYLEAQGGTAFYPHVEIVFRVDAPDEHYHIPLLLSPYGYSTYRGS
ncbi:MAG: hydroxyisourate hydrolase [Alphaproteobacteria bacterium]|nr:hydroxyisourate hydrolase [Alphaproteobacteria bacterium]